MEVRGRVRRGREVQREGGGDLCKALDAFRVTLSLLAQPGMCSGDVYAGLACEG